MNQPNYCLPFMVKSALIAVSLCFVQSISNAQFCQEILFILDDSGSISSSERADMTQSVQALADEIELVNPSVLIGVVQYSTPGQSPPHYSIETPFVNNPTIQNQVTSSINDFLPASIAEMEEDGLFAPGGTFADTDAIFIFTDAWVDAGGSYLTGTNITVSNPVCSPGFQEYEDLSNSLGGIPISVYRTEVPDGSADGIQQGGGILLEGNLNFELSQDQIDMLVNSLNCSPEFFQESNCTFCLDGFDNDGDGFIDLEDADCQAFLDTTTVNTIPVEINLEESFDPLLIETTDVCDSLYVFFERECPVDTVYAQLKFEGSAVIDSDYLVTNLEDTMMLEPLETGIEIGIAAISDGFLEGMEDIQIILCTTNNLEDGFIDRDTITLFIDDEVDFFVTSSDVNYICTDDQIQLSASSNQSASNVEYIWLNQGGDTLGVSPTIDVPAPPSSEFYTIVGIGPCGAVSETMVWANDVSPPEPELSIINSSIPFCPGTTNELVSNVEWGVPGFEYEWSNGFTDANIDYFVPAGTTEPVTVGLTVTDNCDRSTESQITLTPPLIPILNSSSESVCEGAQLFLYNEILSGSGTAPFTYYFFDFNTGMPVDLYSHDPVTGETVISDLDAGNYVFQVEVIDYCGQFDPLYRSSDTVDVYIENCLIPNVFSPNGDGQNDVFIVEALQNRSGGLHIYNRWGNEIFYSAQGIWDGKDFAEGTYFYVVNFNNGEEGLSGHITLLK